MSEANEVNEDGEILVPVTIKLSRREAEEILVAIDQRRRKSSRARDYQLGALGDRIGKVVEVIFYADPGWWQRIAERK